IDIGNVAQVQQDLLVTLGQQIANAVAQYYAAFAQSNAAAQVYDGDAIHLPGAGFHAHGLSSLRSRSAGWPRCFTRMISVPGCRSRKLTSSMKARMIKMPRPWLERRFSGAKGSGIVSGSNPLP